ncbi:MAG TPA: CoA ester lyase [Burkholderiales bacterium]|jgi:citrate lyase beta subunit|nr:CoA ester lyase [Burkholderiales bacterium]
MLDVKRIKALLFTPGNRPERFAKAESTGADGLIIDLEDAVGAGEKDNARAVVSAWFNDRKAPAPADFLICLRINSVYTEAGLRDLLAVIELAKAGCAPGALLLPKVESAVEVELVARHLKGAIPLLALIESAAGLEQAYAIAGASSLRGMAFGGVDLAADLGCAFAWEPLLTGRARVVQAAASRGLGVLDVPYLDIQDAAGLTAECLRAKAMGFNGKLAIHPGQVAGIAAAFTPTAPEVEFAQGVLAAYRAAAGGACTYRGKMIDEPVVIAARSLLARAGAG